MSKGFPKLLWVAVAFLSISLASIAWAQQPAQQDSLSADEIVDILQNNPDVMADAKAEIAQKAQERGYEVSEDQITDQQLFDQIQTNDDVRARFSQELIGRGFGHQTSQSTAPTTPAKPNTAATKNSPTNTAATNNTTPDTTDTKKTPLPMSANGSPYKDLNALDDLYGQSLLKQGKLERFGASLFKNSAILQGKSVVDVPVSSDYVLGPGDEVIVQQNGGDSRKFDLTVDHEGRISLPVVGAVMVAGKTIGDARQSIQSALSREYRDVSVDVSLARVRTVRVYVVGDVKNPGAYDISALSTALNALLVAGGPTDTGSMRTVKHYRGKNLVEEADLYELLLHGVTSEQGHLQSGDSILVPPIGPQVTVAGMVRRPAIYELHGPQTLDQVLNLAGGVLVSGELGKIKVERIQAHDRKVMLNLNLPNNPAPTPDDPPADALYAAFKKFAMQDGDYVTVSRILPYTDQTVYLQGHVFRPGRYPFKDGATVKDLVNSFDDLLPEAADRAEIVRLKPPEYRPLVIPFNIRAVLDGKEEAPKLQAFDTIRIYGRYEADAPTVAIYGEVLRPGVYPLSEHMSAADLVRMAGGFKRSAFTENADLASYQIVDGSRVEVETRLIAIGRALAGDPDTDVRMHPGDVLTVRQLGGWDNIGGSITVEGQVLHPGVYGIQPGEHLSSILKRAGGFIDDAYPNGAVLERKQVKEIAAKNRDDLIRKLQEQELDGEGKTENIRTNRQRQALIDQLKQIEPNGRLVIRIAPQIEKWQNSSEDVEVRPGDKILIPKTPNFVLVAGQVYNPTAIAYTPGRSANWYLQQAGGATSLGNRKDAFVVRANGSVVGRGSGDLFSGGALDTALQPGDTVYVPEKLSGSKRIQNLAQAAQITSGIAIAAHVAGVF